MSKNKNSAMKRGRGRPHTVLVLPSKSPFTITDIQKENGVSRLTVYNQIDDGTLQIKATKETRPTGGPGKPGVLFVTTSVWKRSNANKKAAKLRKMNTKLATAAPVDMTPAPVAKATVVKAKATKVRVVKAKAPVVATPVIETPVTAAPVIEAPVIEAPVIEAPVIEA